MGSTPKYGLGQPAGSEQYSIHVHNDNMTKIDNALGGLQSGVETLEANLIDVQNTVETLGTSVDANAESLTTLDSKYLPLVGGGTLRPTDDGNFAHLILASIPGNNTAITANSISVTKIYYDDVAQKLEITANGITMMSSNGKHKVKLYVEGNFGQLCAVIDDNETIVLTPNT